MLIVIAGGVLAALGLVAAALLVAAPLGWGTTPGLTLWVLFPLFTLIGYALIVVGSRDPAVKAPTMLLAVPLLLMALVAAVGLMAGAAGLAQVGASAPLWYVLVVGGVLGVIGSAAGGRVTRTG